MQCALRSYVVQNGMIPYYCTLCTVCKFRIARLHFSNSSHWVEKMSPIMQCTQPSISISIKISFLTSYLFRLLKVRILLLKIVFIKIFISNMFMLIHYLQHNTVNIFSSMYCFTYFINNGRQHTVYTAQCALSSMFVFHHNSV